MLTPLLLAIGLSLPGLAGEPRPLGYADALREALSNNPSLISAQAGVSAAGGSLISARGSFDPTLGLSVGGNFGKDRSTTGYGEMNSEWSSMDWDLSLSQYAATGTSLSLDWTNSRSYSWYLIDNEDWSLENESNRVSTRLTATVSQALLEGHRMAYNLQSVRSAERGLASAEASLVAARLDTVADTAIAYWNLHYQQALESIALEALGVAEEEGRVVTAMVDAGRLAPMELSRVKAAVAQARSTYIEAQNARQAASDALCLLMGGDPAVPLVAVSAPEPAVRMDLDPDKATEVAMAHNPDMVLMRVEVQGAEDTLDMARHARLPQLDATGTLSSGGYEDSFSASLRELAKAGLPQWYLGAQLSVPLGNRADAGNYTAAQAGVTQAQQNWKATALSVASQVRAQVRTVEAGWQRMLLAAANLEAAEDTLAAEKSLQREGRAIQRDVLEAMKNVSSAQGEVARARTEYAMALVELGRLQGRIEGVAR